MVLVAVFLLLLVLEAAFPLRRRTRPRTRRLLVNFALTAGAMTVGLLVVRPVGLAVSYWSRTGTSASCVWSACPPRRQSLLGLVLMDLTFYWWHRANHRFFLLWRFHGVHHLDPDLDVTTATRFHFGEILYSTGFRVLQAGLLGVDAFTYLLYKLSTREPICSSMPTCVCLYSLSKP